MSNSEKVGLAAISKSQQGSIKPMCKIGGVDVLFPMTPYPSQVGCMNMLIQGLKRGHNCLLESPTGSGKTLAMLSAALAWQRQAAETARKHNAKVDDAYRRLNQKQDVQIKEPVKNVDETSHTNPFDTTVESGNGDEPVKTEGNDSLIDENIPTVNLCDSDSDDDFQETKRTKISKVKQTPAITPRRPTSASTPVKIEAVVEKPKELDGPPLVGSAELNKNIDGIPQRMKVPKIFFATRTHQQIAQVTRELRKTAYKTSRTVILSSRENTCVNPVVYKKGNKNEACKELLDTTNMGGGCGWFNNSKKFGNFDVLPGYGLKPGYDLEDFVKAGQLAKACPYYASRNLMDTADMILCPYNYLIDANIRKSMGIELAGQIVIFDEGHNMEDASREAISYSVSQFDIQTAMQDCEKMTNCGLEPHGHERLANMLSSFSTWIDANQNNFMEVDFNTTGYVWNGTSALASFDVHGITSHIISGSVDAFRAIMQARELENEKAKDRGFSKSDKPLLPSISVMAIENILRMCTYLTKDNGRYREDFRVALMRSTAKSFKREKGQPKISVTLNLWCLNPAIAFSEITSVARSVIITSGTLSPFDSFQSELGCPFPTKLECQHVIKPEQILAKVINRGRKGIELRGTYQNVNSFDYQDEIGNIVLDVCNIMPYGVLVFFPSYRVMDVLKDRWQMTGVLDAISANKRVFYEPRTGAADFLETIQDYYETIREATCNPSGVRGALFMAVCRGKVSEGLDFADNNARAVLCIGIPFPNAKNLQVSHKKSYNDANRARGLLSGNKWYEIQAFRALNQAMGRCIRHKDDFGAVYLLDCRFGDNDYLQPLPKWFRTRVTFSKWDNMAIRELSDYFEAMAPLLTKMEAKNNLSGEIEPISSPDFDMSQTQQSNDDSFYFSGMKVEESLGGSVDENAVTSKVHGRNLSQFAAQTPMRMPSMKRQREDTVSPKEGSALSSWLIPNSRNPNTNSKGAGGTKRIIF